MPIEKHLFAAATISPDEEGEVVGPSDAELVDANLCHERILNEFRVLDDRTTVFNFVRAER